METENILGLAIGERSVQAAEIARTGASAAVTAIDDWENTLLGTGEQERINGQRQFTEYLGAFLKVNRVKAFSASIALDTSFLFLHSFPCDEGASRADIQDDFLWEMKQLRPETDPKQFITDVHKIQTPPPPGSPADTPPTQNTTCLGVAVPRAEIKVLSQILTGFGLKINVIDADHFSADIALRVNYPDTQRRNIALVGVKEHRVDVSILREGNLESYRYHVVRSNQDIAEEIGRIARETRGVQSIVTYGPFLDRDLLVLIRRASPLLVEAMNPLRHVQVSDALRIAEHLSMPSYRFAAAVGVALRKD
jgi:Tfp pilus assembly PilM family ATPase